MVCEGTGLTITEGRTVIVSFTAGPGHPEAVGVIVYITIPVFKEVLFNVCEGIEAVLPEAIKPVMPFGELPFQLKVVPATDAFKAMVEVAEPLHII